MLRDNGGKLGEVMQLLGSADAYLSLIVGLHRKSSQSPRRDRGREMTTQLILVTLTLLGNPPSGGNPTQSCDGDGYLRRTSTDQLTRRFSLELGAIC